MKIKWYKVRSNLYAKINKNSIILNASCKKILSEYAYCRLGLRSDGSICIHPISYDIVENEKLDGTIFRVYNARTYSRISCTDFINEVSKTFEAINTAEKKYSVVWDERENLFTIDLKSEVKDDD